MKYTVLNDLHLGVIRSGGTTQESASALRAWAMKSYGELLNAASGHVIINGDMFDTYNVPLTDLLDAYQITSDWLHYGEGASLTLIPGNHDLSKNSANIGSFQLLAHLLIARFPNQVRYLQGGNWVDEADGIYAISHVPNQDLFDLELGRVPEGVKTLLLHCNYDNTFACASDHSLNLMRDQAKVLVKRGITVVLGHEHQGRTMMGEKVIIVGNQFPTSIADCLPHGEGQKDGTKYLLTIDGEDMELVPTWGEKQAIGDYEEVDWQTLGSSLVEADFVRVTGKANASQAADVIKSISKLRQKSEAFVITNAVKIEGVEGEMEIAESVEDIRAVNVMDMLLESLDSEQQVVVRKLLEEDVK